MHKSKSILLQEEAGTLARNRHILELAESGIHQADLARNYNVTPQRLSQIIDRAKRERGRFYFIKRLFHRLFQRMAA